MDPFYDDSKQVAELESLRNKLTQLRDSFSPFLQATDPNYPYAVVWPDVLNKFNILVARFVSVNRTLNDNYLSTLKKLLLHPYEPVASDHEQQVLSILLRTKLIPEVEKVQDAYISDAEQNNGADIRISLGKKLGSANAQAEELKLWKAKVEAHDAVCLSTEQSLDRCLEELRPRLKLRIVDEAEEQASAAETTGPLGGPSQAFGPRRTEASNLEQLVMFMSSGPKPS
ncbi:hypothetical protein H4R34_003968 [Dimargaris verticillata]|uniref:Mediator of RNA polymerase II transcription subunit 8 n=1 Tax=Dimargaris verticillata TaxID=2761393 RepID=A0A9W8AZ27_9FUNG|nr:hypothetical protein H4R34_003968 [Dimargaris verticillata]